MHDPARPGLVVIVAGALALACGFRTGLPEEDTGSDETGVLPGPDPREGSCDNPFVLPFANYLVRGRLQGPGRDEGWCADGENNAGAVDPSTAAEAAAALGVRVYAVGVGAESSPFGPAPGRSGGVDEAALRAVAERTGGRAFRATDAGALRRIYDEISDLERTTVQADTTAAIRDLYPLLLWPALLLLVLDILLATTRLRNVTGPL